MDFNLRNTTQFDVDIVSQFANYHNFKLLIVPDDVTKISQYNFPQGSVVLTKARHDVNTRIDL